MANTSEKFPGLVKEVRRQIGLSQGELAPAPGVSFATVNRWENGKTVPSKLAQLSFESFYAKMSKQGKLKHGQV